MEGGEEAHILINYRLHHGFRLRYFPSAFDKQITHAMERHDGAQKMLLLMP